MPPAFTTALLVKRSITLRLGIGWLKGSIARQGQVRTRHLYDYSLFIEHNGSTRTHVKPLFVEQVLGRRLVGEEVQGAAGVPRLHRGVSLPERGGGGGGRQRGSTRGKG